MTIPSVSDTSRLRLTRRAAVRSSGVAAGVASFGLSSARHGASAQPGSTPVSGNHSDPSGRDPFTQDEQPQLETLVTQRLAEGATPGALVGVGYPGRGT